MFHKIGVACASKMGNRLILFIYSNMARDIWLMMLELSGECNRRKKVGSWHLAASCHILLFEKIIAL